MKLLQNIAFIIVLSLFGSSANAAWKYLSKTVPHVNEFDSAENPDLNYWCGHAALKSVGMYYGVTKTLGSIHNTFYKNSAGYRKNTYCTGGGSWCASLQDLWWAAALSQNNGYGFGYARSVKFSYPSDKTGFLLKSKMLSIMGFLLLFHRKLNMAMLVTFGL